MQGNQGSARTEAERLVATVLAMASASGLGGSSGDSAGKGGVGMLGDLVTGFLGAGSAKTPHGETPHSQTPHSETPRAPGGWATGAAECCVCPICKVIAGLRDPSPQTAERLATGAGDFAAGLASLLRAFSTAAASTGSTAGHGAAASDVSTAGDGAAASDGAAARTDGDPWAAATAAGDTPAERVKVPRPTRRPTGGPGTRPVPPPAPGADPWAAATTNHDAGTGDEARPDGVA